jgi:glycosyltransferase involved in cell wall biosynthesis
VPDVVVPGAGLLGERGDHEGIASALARLSADPALRRQMGERARENVKERYRAASLLERMTELYDELLRERNGVEDRA